MARVKCASVGEKAPRTETQKVTSKRPVEFTIEAIVKGDDCENECGRTLRSGVYCATNDVSGGPESYHPINIESIKLLTRGSRNVHWRIRAFTSAADEKDPEVPHVHIPNAKRRNYYYVRKRLRETVIAWCSENPGFVISIAGPGARSQHERSKRHHEYEFAVLAREEDGNCMAVAVANAIDCVKGREAANEVLGYFEAGNPHCISVKGVSQELHATGVGCELRKLSILELRAFETDAFKWLAM